MESPGTLVAIRQLCAAAEILANAGPSDKRSEALQALTLFRRFDRPDSADTVTSDDGLFSLTAQAALTMAGRNEFLASYALLEQARSLLPAH